jgi:hypothetical protein
MTPEELADALAGVPEHELLEAFATALRRRPEAPAPGAWSPDPEILAALEQATEAAEENDVYESLFGKPKPIPLSPEDQEIYEAAFGPGTGADE